MCPPVLIAAAAAGTAWGAGAALDRKAKKKSEAPTQAALKQINKQPEERIEQNKLANSTQSTEELKNPTLAEQLKQQKVPLNTGSTGTSFSTPTSVGLNLGGY